MNKTRVQQIIKEEIDRVIKMQEMAMTPDERRARRRDLAAEKDRAVAAARREREAKFGPHDLGEVPGSEGELEPAGPLPGMMSYKREKVAYIEPEFQAEQGIYTVDDFKQAYADKRAIVWSAGDIGGAQPSSYTIVPADANPRYDEATGEPGYPYAYTKSVRDPSDMYKRGVKTIIRTGVGMHGGLGGPRPMSDFVMDRIEQFFTEIIPLPALTMKKKEAEAEAEAMSQESAPAEEMPVMDTTEMEPMTESIVRRWNKAAGLLK